MDLITFGRYQIKRELGRGGMSTVYLALDPRMKREVVIKVLPAYFQHDSDFRTRFQREAEIVASLEHSAIVPVHDFGEENEQSYLVMRYMAGGSLADRLSKGPMPIDEIIPVLRRIGAALDYAHSQKVVHRDLKPGNILFDQSGEAYLADFGIARMLEGNTVVTTMGGIVGTPAYMSPEQARGEKVDGRSDTYSLGIVVFEMLTGRKPFVAETPLGVITKVLLEHPPPILTLKPDLPPAVGAVLDRTLAKEPNGRYLNGESLVSAFEQATKQTQPVMPVIKPPEPIQKQTPSDGTYILPDLTKPPPLPASSPSPVKPITSQKTRFGHHSTDQPLPRAKIVPGAGGKPHEPGGILPPWAGWVAGGILLVGLLFFLVRQWGGGLIVTDEVTATATITAVSSATFHPPTVTATAGATQTAISTATFTATSTRHLTATPTLITPTQTATLPASPTTTQTPTRQPTRSTSTPVSSATFAPLPSVEPTIANTAVPPIEPTIANTAVPPPPPPTEEPTPFTPTEEPTPFTPTEEPTPYVPPTATAFTP